MSTSANPNLAVVRRKADEMGAAITDIREGRKHTIVTFLTKSNRKVQMQVSRYRVDPHVMAGWTRQALTKPDPFEDALLNVANDNSP